MAELLERYYHVEMSKQIPAFIGHVLSEVPGMIIPCI